MLDAAPDRPIRRAKAHAKLNLALAVGPPRDADGMHPIASWMARIDLADDLEVVRLEPDRISRYAIMWAPGAPRPTPIDWSITKDLAVRAHLLLEQEVGRPLPVQVKLEKRIPVGGGLGGGSSDAAAMLLTVRELFGLEVEDARLAELALALGSDVPFFLTRGPALVEGLGDRLTPGPAAQADVILIIPAFGCPTGAVYREFDRAPPERPGFHERAATAARLAADGRVTPDALFNDLAPPAVRAAPELGRILEAAADAAGGARVSVTGSGSTCFIVCDGLAGDPNRMIEDLADELDGCVVLRSSLR